MTLLRTSSTVSEYPSFTVHQFLIGLIVERVEVPNTLCITSYNYLNLLFGYGSKKEVTCNISWSYANNKFHMKFLGGINAVNAHSITRKQLNMELNYRYNLTNIVQLLDLTYSPLASIAKLPIIPCLCTPVSRLIYDS